MTSPELRVETMMTFASASGLHTNQTARNHGIENATRIMRDPKGMHSDQVVLEACAFLMEFGDPASFNEAFKVQQSVMAEIWKRRNDHHEEDGAFHGLLLLGLVTVGLIAYAIFGWPL